MSYNLVNPETGDLTRVAGGSFSIPVGTLISQYKKVAMSGYLYCDGSTFDENKYPALYMYLGTNVLPDYRECVMVGAEENTTDTIATHDVYGEGEFKDDQYQKHTHYIADSTVRNRVGFEQESGPNAGIANTKVGSLNDRAWIADIKNYDSESRPGTTTHGKQKAVYVYIKATSGLAENQQENVLNDTKNYINNSMDRFESKYSEENILTSTDWNTLNTKARYYFSGGTPMTNSPEGVPFGLLEVINVGSYCRIQRYFAFNDGKLYIRRWSGNSWNKWYRFDGISI